MRVMIATATAGGGHLAASAALEEAWRATRPGDDIEVVDVVRFFSPLHRKVHADGYVKIVEKAPELWGYVFQKTDNPEVTRRLARLQRIFPSHSRARFIRHVQDFEADVVVCTHYFPLQPLRTLKDEAQKPARRGLKRHVEAPGSPRPKKPFVVSVVTDFEAHAFWMDPSVDLYCVAAEETRARLIARGASEKTVVPTGIPIAGKFSRPVDAKTIRKRMGLRDDLPVLLVLSGGFGMGPVAEILAELNKAECEFQTVVVTGRNEQLRRDLSTLDHQHPTDVLGFASNMHELMTVADLIITKPGGLTTSEALALGKPLFILHPIPGQEAANSDFLLERGAALKANRVEDIPFRLSRLLGTKKLAEMARAAARLGRATAAEVICREVASRMSLPA
jgi:processive 1,2-diacylglycerol beta-glucosyltransferase